MSETPAAAESSQMPPWIANVFLATVILLFTVAVIPALKRPAAQHYVVYDAVQVQAGPVHAVPVQAVKYVPHYEAAPAGKFSKFAPADLKTSIKVKP